MSFPERLLDSDLTRAERLALEFGAKDGPNEAARRKILQGVLFSAAAVGGASALGVAATPAVKSSVSAIALWLSVGAVGGVVTATTVEVLRDQLTDRTHSAPISGRPAEREGVPASVRAEPVRVPSIETTTVGTSEAPSPVPAGPEPVGPSRAPASASSAVGVAPSTTGIEPLGTAAPSSTAVAPVVANAGEALRAEIARLDEARRKNAEGAHAEALALLAAEGPGRPTVLAPEADLLRLDALAALGRLAEGRALAERFLSTRPDGPLSPRVRAWLVAHPRRE